SASTPGSLRPSRNSRNAPPAVEMYPMRSATPAWVTAATVSPPPTTENADASATARASPSVPAANAGRSNTPMGPFHTMVRAPLSAPANRSTVRGPMSRPIWSAGISRMPTARPRPLSGPSATLAPTGRQRLLQPAPGGGRWQVPRDGGDRRVRAVRGREGIVHVALAERGKGPGEVVVVGFLLGVEAQVLEEEHLTRRHPERPLERLGA